MMEWLAQHPRAGAFVAHALLGYLVLIAVLALLW